MFLHINNFKKQIKKAYKTGLKIGNLNDELIISSGFWAVAIDNAQIPNKIKAVIVELMGELPEPGFLFEISKDAPMCQIVKEYKSVEETLKEVKKANEKLIITPVIIKSGKDVRLFQTIKGEVYGIPEEQYQMIDKTAIDYDNEGEPTGACYIKDLIGNGFYWYNSIGTVVIMPAYLNQQELLKALSTVDFEDKKA